MRWAAAIWLAALAAASAADCSRPFPQHVAYTAGSILPSHVTQVARDAAVADFYDEWKVRYVHAGCVAGQLYIFSNREGENDDAQTISVSEGHGYGMVITALMAGHDAGAREQFDGLFRFFRAHPSRITPGLMSWRQIVGCKDVPGDDDSATDGDLDIAYALLLADAQWGSEGAIHYRDEALKIIAAIKAGDLDLKTPSLKLGDWVGDGKNLHDTRLSDFMTNHFRAFQRATGDELWSKLIDRCYAVTDFLQTKAAPATGLVPDFARKLDTATPQPARAKFLESKFDGDYNYNSCRFPGRIGVDYLLSGDARAKAAVEKIDLFFETKTGGNPQAIRAGYRLASGEMTAPGEISLAFIAPLAVGAMAGENHQAWLDKLWTQIVATPITDDSTGYYGNTLKLLSLLVVSGNWWTP